LPPIRPPVVHDTANSDSQGRPEFQLPLWVQTETNPRAPRILTHLLQLVPLKLM